MTEKKQFSFVKAFVFTAVAFIVIIIIIDALLSLFSKAGFDGFLHNFSYPLIIKYAVAKVVGGIIYGLFMAFIIKLKVKTLQFHCSYFSFYKCFSFVE